MIARTLTTVIAAALVAGMATGACAEEAEDATPFASKSAYVSAGGVYAIENVDGAVVTGDLSNSGGYDLRVGYFVHETVGVEFQWQSMVNFDSDDPNEDSVEARTAGLNARYSPLRGRFQPYVLLGLNWLNMQTDREGGQPEYHKSSIATRFGLGLTTFVTQRLGLTLEAGYILPMSGDLAGDEAFGLVPISASVFFRFS